MPASPPLPPYSWKASQGVPRDSAPPCAHIRVDAPTHRLARDALAAVRRLHGRNGLGRIKLPELPLELQRRACAAARTTTRRRHEATLTSSSVPRVATLPPLPAEKPAPTPTSAPTAKPTTAKAAPRRGAPPDDPKPPAKVEALLALFVELDADGDGQISCREFENIPAVMDELDIGPEHSELATYLRVRRNFTHKMFRRIDKDRSGVIEFREFLQWLMPALPHAQACAAVRAHAHRLTARVRAEADRRTREEGARGWEARFDPAALDELRGIFALYCERVAPGVVGITHESMARALRRPGMTDDVVLELFNQFCPRDTLPSRPPSPGGGTPQQRVPMASTHTTAPATVGAPRASVFSALPKVAGSPKRSTRRPTAAIHALRRPLQRRKLMSIHQVATAVRPPPPPPPGVPVRPYIDLEAFAAIMERGHREHRPPPPLWFQNPLGQDAPQTPLTLPDDVGTP